MLTHWSYNFPALTLNVRGLSYLGLTGQYHGCWCPGSLCHQDISSHDIGYVEYVGPGLTWGRILSTCIISIWSYDIQCKYMFMFPLKNLACKGLTHQYMPSSWGIRLSAFTILTQYELFWTSIISWGYFNVWTQMGLEVHLKANYGNCMVSFNSFASPMVWYDLERKKLM